MQSENKVFLDTNRHHIRSIQNGSVRNIDLKRMVAVMTEEFNPRYGNVDETSFDAVAKLVTDTYRYYDEQIDNPKSFNLKIKVK